MAFVASSTETSGLASSRSGGLQFQTLESGDEAICEWTPLLTVSEALLPRKNLAYNAIAGKGVDILLFGGEMAAGMMADLWTIDCATLQTQSIRAEGEGPTARSGARALLVGNAYIVFGGSSFNAAKKEDASLFLLNTITKTWSVARTTKQKPSSRIGHSFNLIGSKVFVFGGQPSTMADTYANDLWAFDINTLFAANAQWEQLTFEDSLSPCPRYNHSAVTHLGKLYIFGGTDGRQTFFDVWMFDPVLNAWTQIVAQGFIPASRHSHSAVTVSGMMFISGGIDGTGNIMGDFAAFNIATSYWHQFKKPTNFWPAARSCHAMVNVRSKLYVLGGDVSYPANNDSTVHVADVATMKFPVEKPGFSTMHSMRARLASANLHSTNPSGIVDHRRQESDNQSMRSVGSRSIRSIRTDLGRDITAALGAANAQEALERVLSKVRHQKAPSLTAADVRELDKYYVPSTESKKPAFGRSNSVLNYFRRRRGSQIPISGPSSCGLSGKIAVDKSRISYPTSRMQQLGDDLGVDPSVNQDPHKKDIQSLDLQRFLSLEREIYKKNPEYMFAAEKELHPLPDLAIPQQVPQTARATALDHTLPSSTAAKDTVLAPALERVMSSTSGGNSVAPSTTALDRDTQSILRRFGLTGIDSWSGKRAKRRNIASTDSDDASRNNVTSQDLFKSAENGEQSVVKSNQIDSRVLLNALLILRQELQKQKKTLTAERNIARKQADEATAKANKHAQDKLDRLRKADEEENLILKARAKSLAVEESKLKDQVRNVEKERCVLTEDLNKVRMGLSQKSAAFSSAEKALERYVTMEAEAAELSLRQASQAQIIQQVTAHIGTYQLRAKEAEMKVETETYRCNEAEKEILALRSQVSELQLQVKHVHRLTSLAKYNWQTSVEEAETSRNVMIAGLNQLLDMKDATSPMSRSGSLMAQDVDMAETTDAQLAEENEETVPSLAVAAKLSESTATQTTLPENCLREEHYVLFQTLDPVMPLISAN